MAVLRGKEECWLVQALFRILYQLAYFNEYLGTPQKITQTRPKSRDAVACKSWKKLHNSNDFKTGLCVFKRTQYSTLLDIAFFLVSHSVFGWSKRCRHIVTPHTQATFKSPAPLGLKFSTVKNGRFSRSTEYQKNKYQRCKNVF